MHVVFFQHIHFCWLSRMVPIILECLVKTDIIIIIIHRQHCLSQTRHMFWEMLHLRERFLLCFQSNRVIYSIQNFVYYHCPTWDESHKAAPCLAVWDCSMWLKADTGFLERLPAVKDVWPSHIYKHCVSMMTWNARYTHLKQPHVCYQNLRLLWPLLHHKLPPFPIFHFKAAPKLAIWLITVCYAFQSLPRHTGRLVQEKGCQKCRNESLLESQIHLGWLRL